MGSARRVPSAASSELEAAPQPPPPRRSLRLITASGASKQQPMSGACYGCYGCLLDGCDGTELHYTTLCPVIPTRHATAPGRVYRRGLVVRGGTGGTRVTAAPANAVFTESPTPVPHSARKVGGSVG